MAVSKVRTAFRCQACGDAAPKWAGRCGACGEWNSLVEELDVTGGGATPQVAIAPTHPARPIGEIEADGSELRPTGVGELDRVLGGGLVPGSVTLVGGEPGIGKSTLLLQVLAGIAAESPVLYVTAEESAQQVRLRAERLGAVRRRLFLASEVSLPHLIGQIEATHPAVVVVDSIQTVSDPSLSSAPGSVAQVRHCAHRLVALAKERDVAVILVGHVTKEGVIAGPRVLEHIVDTVISFEGERDHPLRMLRAVKHRFGSTQELGLLAMGEGGLLTVDDPSEMFLTDRRPGSPGSVVVPTLEGRRPLLVEIQALVASSPLPQPRRQAHGVDPGRVAMMLAVLDRRLGLPVAGLDTYVMAVGGARITEPAADLALALAVASSLTGVALGPHTVVCGEVGLGGELRSVGQIERRLAEAERLGFRHAVVPASVPDLPLGLRVVRVGTLSEAISTLGLRLE
jgi:DNA repair protein RadA/Sms